MPLRHLRPLAVGLALLSLGGCASLFPPSAASLAKLPVVSFPNTPGPGDFVYKLPAGQPITARVAIEGSALASGAEQTLAVTLPRDLYIHQRWVSEDGTNWQRLGDLLAIHLALSLPSDEHPKPGEILLRIERKDGK